MIRRSKYGNRKVVTAAGTFDSQKEARRFAELRLLERAGRISNLRRQVRYELIPSQRDSSGRVIERSVVYVADFVYYDNDHCREVVEDTKGVRTKEYVIKRKLMLWQKGVRVSEL